MKLIVTPRLLIRDFMPQDDEELYEYLSDPEVTRFEPYAPFSREKARFEARARALNGSFRAVALIDPEVPGHLRAPGVHECEPMRLGRLIGNLYVEPGPFDSYELGYVFNRAFWGHGYACESARALMGELFRGGAHRIYAECATENERSWRLMERLGMRREGLKRSCVAFRRYVDGRPIWWDAYMYAILRDEWRDGR